MKNLVIGTALNYDEENVKPFVLSLRKYYQDDVIFLISNASENFINFLKQYKITTYKIPNSRNQDEICSMRHKYYEKIVSENEFKNVLLSDVRDVIFQKDPFSHEITTDLEFFLEPGVYKDCSCHRHWFVELSIHGREFYDKIGNKKIVCAGTTIGTKTGILLYFEKIIQELSKLNRTVTDQPTHAYMIYNDYFPNYKLYETLDGPVATLSSGNNLKFDSNNNLLNRDGSIVSIVHQWDRTQYRDLFYNKAVS